MAHCSSSRVSFQTLFQARQEIAGLAPHIPNPPCLPTHTLHFIEETTQVIKSPQALGPSLEISGTRQFHLGEESEPGEMSCLEQRKEPGEKA